MQRMTTFSAAGFLQLSTFTPNIHKVDLYSAVQQTAIQNCISSPYKIMLCHTLYLNGYEFCSHFKQEGQAVASIARDDPSNLPGDDPFPHAHMHSQCMWVRVHVGTRDKFASEFETKISYNVPKHFCHRQTDTGIIA